MLINLVVYWFTRLVVKPRSFPVVSRLGLHNACLDWTDMHVRINQFDYFLSTQSDHPDKPCDLIIKPLYGHQLQCVSIVLFFQGSLNIVVLLYFLYVLYFLNVLKWSLEQEHKQCTNPGPQKYNVSNFLQNWQTYNQKYSIELALGDKVEDPVACDDSANIHNLIEAYIYIGI